MENLELYRIYEKIRMFDAPPHMLQNMGIYGLRQSHKGKYSRIDRPIKPAASFWPVTQIV